jgi:hypothetical protein
MRLDRTKLWAFGAASAGREALFRMRRRVGRSLRLVNKVRGDTRSLIIHPLRRRTGSY